ncbi:hypothetical protein GNF86_21110, partial [Clostridium perfringens]
MKVGLRASWIKKRRPKKALCIWLQQECKPLSIHVRRNKQMNIQIKSGALQQVLALASLVVLIL